MNTPPDNVRVLFMGGKAVGCGILQLLIESPRATVCGVVVNPNDMQADRWYPSAAELALAHGIPIRAPERVNEQKDVDWISGLQPDLIVVAYYDQILREPIFSLPPLGCVNLHFALAEKYRGCYPTTWALINGEERTGVTLHRVSREVDGGEILAEREIELSDADTGLSIYNKCVASGIELFGDSLEELLSGQLKGRPQITTADTRSYNRQFPSHEIEFVGDAREVLNRIRALHFPPFPPPFFYIGDERFVIVKAAD